MAARLGAEVTIVDRDGIGGAAVLTDCVPSKTLIATADVMTAFEDAPELGVRVGEDAAHCVTGVDLARVNARVKALAAKQSEDIAEGLAKAGVTVVRGSGRLADGGAIVEVTASGGAAGNATVEQVAADAVIIATGARPRELPSARPDGERILTWTQLYDLDELPEDLIVVGSGVTGAEFAGAYQALGSQVTLVSSRDRVLPVGHGVAPQDVDDADHPHRAERHHHHVEDGPAPDHPAVEEGERRRHEPRVGPDPRQHRVGGPRNRRLRRLGVHRGHAVVRRDAGAAA